MERGGSSRESQPNAGVCDSGAISIMFDAIFGARAAAEDAGSGFLKAGPSCPPIPYGLKDRRTNTRSHERAKMAEAADSEVSQLSRGDGVYLPAHQLVPHPIVIGREEVGVGDE